MIVFLLLLAANPTDELARIRSEFSSKPKAESLAALESLARSAPSTEAGGEAAAWRGSLAQQDKDLVAATRWFEAAGLAPAEGLARRLGARGLGDLDLLAHRYGRARQHFAEASVGATGVLGEELRQKEALAARLQTRLFFEWAAWIFLLAVLGYFGARAWRGSGRWQIPVEAVYAAPVYALLVLGCLGRDENVLRALSAGGAASLVLIAAAGVAARRAPPGPWLRWLQAALLVSANLALFFAVLNRMGLVDTLKETAQM